MSENNNEIEQEVVAVVDYDMAMQPDEEFGPGGPNRQENPAIQPEYTENNPESLEDAGVRLGIDEYWDDRDDDMGVKLGYEYIRNNRFEEGRYVTLTDEGENIAIYWDWYDGRHGKESGLHINYIKQELLPPTQENGYLWTVGPPRYTFNGYDDEIGEEYIAGYTERPDKVFHREDIVIDGHVKAVTDSGDIVYGVIDEDFDGDEQDYLVTQYFFNINKTRNIYLRNIKEHHYDPYDSLDSRLRYIDLQMKADDKSSFYFGEGQRDIKIRYGNVVKLANAPKEEKNPFWIVVHSKVVRILNEDGNSISSVDSVVVQKFIHSENLIYETVKPSELIYVTLNAGNSAIYKDNQVSDPNELGYLLPHNPNARNTGGRFLNKILPISDLKNDFDLTDDNSKGHYDGTNQDWKPPDYRVLSGDKVKIKNDNTIYKVSNMETVTNDHDDLDEKTYIFITKDEWSPSSYMETPKNEKKVLMDDITFVSRYNNWATYFSENYNLHRNSEQFAVELQNDYVKYGKTLVLYKPYWDTNVIFDYYIGILQKSSNDLNPHLYAVEGKLKIRGERTISHKEYEANIFYRNYDVIYESDIFYIFPDNISIDNPAAIENTIKESLAIKEENKRKEKYLAFQTVALKFQKLIIDLFDIFFSNSIEIKGTGKKKNLFNVLFIETVHRKEYHRELKHLEYVLGNIVEKFKDSSKIEYSPRDPDYIWRGVMEEFERHHTPLYQIQKDYDVSNKEVKEHIIAQLFESVASPSQELDYEGYAFGSYTDPEFIKKFKDHEARKRAQLAEWKLEDCLRFNAKRDIIRQITHVITYFLRFLETIDMSQNENLLFTMGKKFLNTIFGLDHCTTKINSSLCSWVFYAEKKVKESNSLQDLNFNVDESTRHNVRLNQIPGDSEGVNSANLQRMERDIRNRQSFYGSCEEPDSIIAYAENNNNAQSIADFNQRVIDRLRERVPRQLQQSDEGQHMTRDLTTLVSRMREQADREWNDARGYRPRSPSYSQNQSPISSGSSATSYSSMNSGNTLTVTCEECGDNQYFDADWGNPEIRTALSDAGWALDTEQGDRDNFDAHWYCDDCGLPGTRMWQCSDCGNEIRGPSDDYPDGWTMDESGREYCEQCQDNYYTCTICGRMDEREGDGMPEGWEDDDDGYSMCPECSNDRRTRREWERQRAQEEKQYISDDETKEGGASNKKKKKRFIRKKRFTRRKTCIPVPVKKKKKKQSRKSKKR
tara:strand:- start:4825 stop:8505 length:3681 start_codon:yes stop_codon:yes gene_type:complete